MSVKGMKFTLTLGRDVVNDRVWFFHALPSLTVAHYGRVHQEHNGKWIRIILQFLLWHIEVQIDKNIQGNGNQELD